jgi:energy-coupling factor transporter ATP-binding protein EcfA2
MQITRIRISNLLSFREAIIDNLDEQMNVVVGPNGVGKTNILNALRVAVDGVGGNRSVWERIARHKNHDRGFRLEIDIRLNGPWERESLRLYLAAALTEGRITPDVLSEEQRRRLSDYLLANLALDGFNFLLSGRLIIEYLGEERWTSRYESLAASSRGFRWHLEGEPRSELQAQPPGYVAPSQLGNWFAVLGPPDGDTWSEFLDGQNVTPPQVDFEYLLGNVGGLHLEIIGNPSLATHQALARHVGVAIGRNSYFTAQMLFGHILRRMIIFSDNVRQLPKELFTAAQLSSPPIDLSSGQQLALYLFGKKNGQEDEREHFRQIGDAFEKLTAQKFDVGIAPHSAVSPTAAEMLTLELRVEREFGDFPLRFAGAGIAEALFLSSLIRGDEGSVILLDEPAQNLHPTMQRALLGLISENVQNQFFVITHSPLLMPPDDLHRVIRASMDAGETQLRMFNPQIPQPTPSLQKALRGSVDARSMMFSRGVILVEGETEFGAYSKWYEEVHGRSADSEDILIFDVRGDGNFEKYVLLLHGFGIPWSIICDGAMVGDSAATSVDRQKCDIAEQLTDAGIANIPPGLDALSIAQRLSALRQLGVFSAALSADKGQEGFEDIPSVKTMIQANPQSPTGQRANRRSKPLTGYNLAILNPCPPEVRSLLQDARSHLARQ